MMKRIFMAGCMAVAVTLSVVSAPLASATESSAIASIPTGTIAYGIAASPDGSKVFVANYSDGTVSVISTATNTVIDTISIGGGAEPYVLAVSPDGSTLYVGNYSVDTVSVVSTATDTITHTISTVDGSFSGVYGLAVSPDGSRLWVANYDSSSVSVINTSGYTQIGSTIPVGLEPYDVKLTPDGTKAYVANYGAGTVTVIDTISRATSTVQVGNLPINIAFSDDGTYAYVTNYGDGTLTRITTATNTVNGAPIVIGGTPWGVTIRDGFAYVADYGTTGEVTVVNLSSWTAQGTIPSGTPSGYYPTFITSINGYAYVANYDGTVGVIALARSASGDQVPTAAMQAYGRAENGTCTQNAPNWVNWQGIAGQQFQSWGLSWQQWPNNGAGGYVCERQPYFTTAGNWNVQ